MKRTLKLSFLSIIIGLFIFAGGAKAQTAGTLTFKVTPTTHSGNYSAKHFIAVWIENGSGTFIKTRTRLGSSGNCNSHLVAWKSKSGSSVVDATTGATLNTYAALTYTWNANDLTGTAPNYNTVPDGYYRISIETAWDDSGTLGVGRDSTSVVFYKGPNAVTLNPTSTTNFTAMNLIWTPAVVAVAPTVTTGTSTNVAQTTATGAGNVTADGGGTITSRGICYATTVNPDTTNSKVVSTGTTGAYSCNLTGLTANTLYHFRAFAKNSAGITYGADSMFTTLAAIAPVVTTGTTSGITQVKATCAGNVTSDGGATIIARGICYATTANPDTSNTHVDTIGTTGAYTCTLTGLTAATIYHYRAYTVNSVGLVYGDDSTFTTKSLTAPKVKTTSTTSITSTTAIGGGNVTSDGGDAITQRGICYATTANPDTTGTHVVSTGTTGVFTGNISGLTAYTTYHVRAYAVNNIGVSYGGDSTFMTLCVKPTTPVISQTGNTLSSNTASGNQWYNKATGAINTATAQTYNPQQIGTYYVIVTVNGCSSDSSNNIYYNNTGVKIYDNNKVIKVYPNPVSNELVIEIAGNTNEQYFEIINSIGQLVFKGYIKEKTTVQTSNFAQGVYLIKLENGKTFEFKKIIKE